MGNSLNKLIVQNHEQILEEWLCMRLATISKQNQPLIMVQIDLFQNQISDQLQEGLKVILENYEKKRGGYTEALVQICEILAIQDYPPSTAMALFYELKGIVRKLIKKMGIGFKAKDWVEFNSYIEAMTLEAFDCYSTQRELMLTRRLASSS